MVRGVKRQGAKCLISHKTHNGYSLLLPVSNNYKNTGDSVACCSSLAIFTPDKNLRRKILNSSMPFKALIMGLVCILYYVHLSEGYSNALYSCETVRILHGPVESLSGDEVTVELVDVETKEYKTCYEPNTVYNGK